MEILCFISIHYWYIDIPYMNNERWDFTKNRNSHETILQPDLFSIKSTTLNQMIKSDLVTDRGVTIPFLFLQATIWIYYLSQLLSESRLFLDGR